VFRHHYVRALIFIFLIIIPVLAHPAECFATRPENFSKFFEKFVHNKQFASSRTLYPLKIEMRHYEVDARGNKTSETNTILRLKQDDAKTESLSVEMERNELSFKILSINERAAIVNVSGNGDDMLFNHHFSKVGNCWFQEKLEDYSL
jgi:hypothetical protein